MSEPNKTSNLRTGGQILIDQLAIQGVERVTCVPGESYLAALDALHDSKIDVMICRAERGTPMILCIGQVDTAMREREAFQEVDYKAFFGSMAKWVVEIDTPDRIPELVARAFRVATQGRPGPVVIALPENMLVEKAAVSDAPRVHPAVSWPAPCDMAGFDGMLAQAKAPIVVL